MKVIFFFNNFTVNCNQLSVSLLDIPILKELTSLRYVGTQDVCIQISQNYEHM